MVLPKPMRLLAFISLGIFFYLCFLIFSSPVELQAPGTGKIEKMTKDPNLEPTGEPPEPLRRVVGNNYAPNNPNSERINATLLALVRNNELKDMLQSIRDLERTWNRKFNYPWLFLNDEPFTEEFKTAIRGATKAEVKFGMMSLTTKELQADKILELVPADHWDTPSWINEDLYQESVKVLKEQGVQYMDKKSYHNMCRWNSGMFYKHPALLETQYYWRVEPNVHFFCDVDYDVFRYMQDHNKTYGFTVNLYDSPESVAGLWPSTQQFIADHPEYVHPNSAIKWLQDKTFREENYVKANGYSTCHFWSNFEIGDMSFWRSKAYEEYFQHLDRAGGFFYERWGDAPVHSIGLGLFEDQNKIHWFRDIGYQHIPFFNCPNSPKCSGCVTGQFTDGDKWLNKDDCRPAWFKYVGMG